MLENKHKRYCLQMFYKYVFLNISQNSQENTCAWAFFLMKLKAFIQQLTEIFKNPYITEHRRAKASLNKILNYSGKNVLLKSEENISLCWMFSMGDQTTRASTVIPGLSKASIPKFSCLGDSEIMVQEQVSI